MIYETKTRTRRFYTFVAFLAILGIVGGIVLSKLLFGGISAAELQDRLVEVRRGTCQEQNARNRNTIAAIDKQIAAIPDPERRHRAEEQSAATELIINALVPVRDCDAYAAELTK